MKKIDTYKYKPLLNAIIILVGVQLGVYVYSASLPYMQQDLHTTPALINNTLTVFVFAIGISQLFTCISAILIFFLYKFRDKYLHNSFFKRYTGILWWRAFYISKEHFKK